MLSVLFFTVFAAVDFLFLIRKDEDMGKLLLDGGDASGILTPDHVFDLLRKHQFLLGDDLTVLDHVDGNVVVDKGQHVQVKHIDVTFYL